MEEESWITKAWYLIVITVTYVLKLHDRQSDVMDLPWIVWCEDETLCNMPHGGIFYRLRRM